MILFDSTILLFPLSLPLSLSPSLPPPLSLLLSHQILSTLETHPLQSLRPSEKVSIISLLIEDLLGSPALCREVDTKMEQISTLRREKWKINLKLKRYVTSACVKESFLASYLFFLPTFPSSPSSPPPSPPSPPPLPSPCHLLFLSHGPRFRSRLSSVFGVGEKKRLVVYSGRGRPPKRAFMAGEGSQVGGASVAGWVWLQWLGGCGLSI